MILPVLGLLAVTLQVETPARVAGAVLDASTGVPLAGATLTLVEAGVEVVSGTAGTYLLALATPGPQHLRVRRLGYAARTVHLLVPRTGTLEVDVALEPRPFAVGPLLISARSPVRGVDPADSTAHPDRGVSASSLRHHPTLAQPDAFRALSGGEVVVDPEAGGGVHVRGGTADQTAYALDGIPVLNPHHAAGLFSAWNPDALASVRIVAAVPAPGLPDALSGVVDAETRTPGDRFGLASSLSTTEARVTVDGPLGPLGYVVSGRKGLAGAAAPDDEASYLAAETHDVLASASAPVLGGRLRFLHYVAENDLATAREVVDDGQPVPGPPNRFAWSSRSTGVGWSSAGAVGLRATLWRATTTAGSGWDGAVATSSRDDVGAALVVARGSSVTGSEAGLRVGRSATAYRVEGTGEPAWRPRGSVIVGALWAEHRRPLGATVAARAAAKVSWAGGRGYLAPQGQLTWEAGRGLTWKLAASRAHQFSQSLRNPESPAALVFPAELFLGPEVPGVPVAWADQAVLAARWRPAAGVRIAAQGFVRRLRGVLLVPLDEAGPFATAPPRTGAASARGVALDASARGARYGFVASWGLQRVRFGRGGSAYAPRHGTTHLVETGLAVYPTPTVALRAAVTAAAGRPTTALTGPLEWEVCNVVDRGCEFAGSPRLDGPPGAGRLPYYARVDLGARKHWHARARDRDVVVAAFGTVANVFGRDNVWTWAGGPGVGGRGAVGMLPRTPLVLGLDVRFD